MQIKNIEHSLRKTMVAVFKKQGLPEAAAVAKATANLSAAVSKFNEAQTRSIEARPTGTDLSGRLGIAARVAAIKEAAKAASPSGPSNKKGSHIKSASKKITSAEQVALHKASAPPGSNRFLATKTGASVAISLGAVAQWAKTLA